MNKRLCAVGGIVLLLGIAVFSSIGLAGKKTAASEDAPMDKPLAFGRDWVDVSAEGNLLGRYRFRGDWEKEFASYLEDARVNQKARGTPGRKVTMGCVFLKNASITLQDVPGGDGKPMTGTYTTPEKFVDQMMKEGMKEYSDYMFAFSGGELEVEWVVETVENMHWVQTGKNTGWGCQPKALGDQILKALEKYKDRGVCMWMFCAGRPTTLNPLAGEGKARGIGAPPYGISYTAWPLHGGYTLVMCDPSASLMVHEFNHRFLDNMRQHEGVLLTGFHGLGRMGFWRAGFPDRLFHVDYRYTYQYMIPRDMWRRFTIVDQNATPRETFSGKAYAWESVKDDCWFKLPELSDADLAKLTGIASVTITGDRKSQRDFQRCWKVSTGDRGAVLSAYLDDATEQDRALNNALTIGQESCAILKTASGHWLLVKKELADVYVEMLKIAGKGDTPLPVYGYVNRDVLPLVVMKAPTELALPGKEIGYFR